MTVEDDVDDLLDTSVPLVNTDVVANVATLRTTFRSTESEVDELLSEDDDVKNVGMILCNIQKNNLSTQIIGSVHEDMHTIK